MGMEWSGPDRWGLDGGGEERFPKYTLALKQSLVQGYRQDWTGKESRGLD